VTKPDVEMDRVRAVPLFQDEMVAVVPAEHPWARLPHVAAEHFTGAHLVLYEVYDQNRIPSFPLPVPHGARPARISTVPVITDLLIEMVAGGQGVTVLPHWVAAPYAASHSLALVPLGPEPLTRTWFLATRRDPPAPHLAAFVEELTARLGEQPPKGP
jgi:LysR family transcriptional regulator for metE and metH